MTVKLQMEEAGIFRRHPNCPLCKEKASKIWISHEEQWMPIGIFCKKCGAVEIYGLPTEEVQDSSPTRTHTPKVKNNGTVLNGNPFSNGEVK